MHIARSEERGNRFVSEVSLRNRGCETFNSDVMFSEKMMIWMLKFNLCSQKELV